MAFEKTTQGMQAFLASKQAGAHPLAQHLNFKSALKEARIAMAAKQLESERGRKHDFDIQDRKFQQESELQHQKIQASPPEGALKTKDLFSEFERTGREFAGIRDSFSRLEASGKDPSAAGDLALIFNYMKILDPGSVVRESEFANAAASGALGERFIAVGKKIAQGKRLSDNVRNDFLDRGKRLFNAKQRQFKKDEIGFRRLAEQNRINPESFMRDLGIVGDGTNINNVLEGL